MEVSNNNWTVLGLDGEIWVYTYFYKEASYPQFHNYPKGHFILISPLSKRKRKLGLEILFGIIS